MAIDINTILLALTGGIYSFIALGYVGQRRYGMAVAFFAYSLANLGFVLDLWQVK